jgi:hypothetical protein
MYSAIVLSPHGHEMHDHSGQRAQDEIADGAHDGRAHGDLIAVHFLRALSQRGSNVTHGHLGRERRDGLPRYSSAGLCLPNALRPKLIQLSK